MKPIVGPSAFSPLTLHSTVRLLLIPSLYPNEQPSASLVGLLVGLRQMLVSPDRGKLPRWTVWHSTLVGFKFPFSADTVGLFEISAAPVLPCICSFPTQL